MTDECKDRIRVPWYGELKCAREGCQNGAYYSLVDSPETPAAVDRGNVKKHAAHAPTYSVGLTGGATPVLYVCGVHSRKRRDRKELPKMSKKQKTELAEKKLADHM